MHTHTHIHTYKVVLLLSCMQQTQTVNELVIGVYVDPDLQNMVIAFMLPWLTNLYDINKVSCMESVDWTTRLEYWNGLNCCKIPFSCSFLGSGY